MRWPAATFTPSTIHPRACAAGSTRSSSRISTPFGSAADIQAQWKRAMRIALSQINPIVGDLAGNRAMMLERLEDAKRSSADMVLFPELAVTGYPPEDLLLRPGFVRAAWDA